MLLQMSIEQLYVASKKLNNVYPQIKNELFSLDIFWCRIALSQNAYWNFKEHSHSFFELHIPLSGKAKYCVHNQEVFINKGMLLLFPPQCKHAFLDVFDNYAEFVFGFDLTDSEQLLKLLNANIDCYHLSKANSYIYALIKQILKNAYEEKIGHKIAIENQLSCLVIHIIQDILKNLSLKHEQNYEITNITRMRLIMNYINDNLSTVTVNDIANNLHISARQLNRIIYTALSMTTIELINDKRIRTAKQLIQSSDNSLSMIAELVGFKSLPHFSKVFKKAEGLSPSAYRKDVKK